MPDDEDDNEAAPPLHQQRDQPPGVPPLALTGERTLPDVPEENYWFARHLVVYDWIAAQIAGRRVVDMACGEGYGSDALARAGATAVVGVDANPEAHEHARLRYVRDNLRFVRTMVQTYDEPCDAIVFLQTIEHVEEPGALLARFRELVGSGVVYVSTPNVLTLAPPGAERSGNPWHVYEYRPEEFAALCGAHFGSVRLYGLFHARKLAVHQVALKLGWDRVHPRLRLTKRFYDRFVPAIDARDFVLRPGTARELRGALDLVAVLRS
ncbi:MAG: methyltransferase domain-containing protein [Solirubrobacteraceae bacterium]|nr:methyltransferase domain-containing protein [Solirubrobacteraceae bacterium]